MAVSFDVDEKTALRLRRALGAGNSWAKVPAAMGLSDEQGFPRAGKIESTAASLNPEMGTLRVRAVFPNTDGLLLPGMFCRVRLTLPAATMGP